MLVLTRRVGEKIQIGAEVFVTVLGIKGNQVRIGIDAPKEINIVRTEIIPKLEKDGKEVYTEKTDAT